MEFPKLGCHCSEPSCKKLDFLPIKCDGCSNLYCNDHFKYSAHFCSNAFKNNVQVPECPLCGMPVPIPRNQQPDVAVGAHIDRDCRWDPSKERKVFTNKCTLKGCKTKEIIPVLCPECDNNFCLRHRHTADHNCIGSKATIRAKMYNAAADRNLSTKNAKPLINTKGIQDQNMDIFNM
ncbi:AN1-type zinc finger protein 2A-like [Ctenocephalides felis]|uniref:AN1-type zinc finger protein 2A-like n=1 Tax=Ctenocephalides felis TaxID=7515 RepID=UPI000E6E3E8C|nr:AN1-type zinc finger protein 2A-like [Ctenocephalides felis]